MDATNGVSGGRPLNWLPSGLTALILSLERTDSLAVQLKAFSVTQAVKSLLSLKKEKKKEPDKEVWGVPSHRSASLDALRELANPFYGMHLSGFPLASHAGCQCEEFCECCGCGEPDCALCESCVSEDDFEYEEHHVVAPELLQSYHWGLSLAGGNPCSPKCASDAYLRREPKPQRFASKNWGNVQNFGWAKPLQRRAALEEDTKLAQRGCPGKGKIVEENVVAKFNAQDSEEVVKKPSSMWSANFALRRKDNNVGQVQGTENLIRNKPGEDSSTQRISGATEVNKPGEDSSTQRIGGATEANSGIQNSHATLKPIQDRVASLSSQCAPVVRAIPKWWPFGIQPAAAVVVEPCSAAAKWNFRMGQNAGAGALAGGVVSLCLHPIDTLKTIVQSQTGGSRNLLPILSSVISERGMKGLYRGLGSNLASSAPTSAIYTLTYEAIKAGLLRRIPEEMSALAHCGAGACASVATSIVYTPSECVKQQMQVNGLYQNSWQTFTSLLKQGGLPMLYKGWGAVLCRNVPQSVIKFYTYEALKHWAQGDQPRDTPLTTLQALAIGGVAGSTAAFFTTPFDVVKTRLQTQIPASVQQYNGVMHAFQYIATTEGVAGLYRGLVPRLVIYVTQGALFFASYEFIKHVLAVEVPRLRIRASPIEGYQRQSASIPAEST